MKATGKKYLDQLIHALDQKCSNTKKHNDKYRKVFANYRAVAGFNELIKELMFTLVINKSFGAHIFDIDDNKYLDISMGFGVHLFGHRPEFINNAILQQIEKGYSLGPLYSQAAEVAYLIHEMTGVERISFFNSGTEAVMVAIRLAKAVTAKNKIVVFSGSYHGTFDSLLSIRANAITRQAEPHVPGVTENIIGDTYILKYGNPESLEFIKSHGSELAAVLSEPVQSRNPGFLPGNFLSELRSICTEHNITLIFDEIISGFRYSNTGAAGFFNLEPDLITYGKTIGGGLPIGIVSGKSKFMNYIDGGQWKFYDNTIPTNKTTFVAGTFCHHPLAMACAKEVLQRLKANPSIQVDLNRKTTEMCLKLNRFMENNCFPIRVDNFGSLFYFKLKGNARYIFYGLLNEGIYVWEGRTCFLSTAHSEKDVQVLIKTVMKVSYDLREAGFFN